MARLLGRALLVVEPAFYARAVTSNDRFTGAREKLRRAGEHIDQLAQETAAFFADEFRGPGQAKVTITATDDALRTGISGTTLPQMQFDVPIPATRWGVLVGDALHNLRSALDNAVDELTVEQSGSSLARTGFPIFSDERRFKMTDGSGPTRGSGGELLRGVKPELAGLFERLQPYHSKSPQTDPLWFLHELSNVDKHHVPAVVAVYSDLPRVGVVREITRDGSFVDETELLPFDQGLEKARMAGADKGKRIRMEFDLVTLFGQGPAEGEEVIRTLRDIHARVTTVLDELEAAAPGK